MLARRIRVALEAKDVLSGFEGIRKAMQLPGAFPPEAEAEARAAGGKKLGGGEWHDLTEVPFLTIDPPGSMDLDQAFYAERRAGGFRIHYAIADPSGFIEPGGALDAESRRRGQTLYAPDNKVPLYPVSLSEAAASLLPNELRPSVVWTIDLDDAGDPTHAVARRSLVTSRRRLTYEDAQREIDADASEPLALLKRLGTLRQERERERGGMNLELPEQEVVRVDDRFELRFRGPLPVEGWNAQISLLTGMCAAKLMLENKIGLLRTMPPPDEETVRALRAVAELVGVEWPEATTYQAFISSLDPAHEGHASVLTAATRLFRGTGYVAFDGDVPPDPLHHAIAAPYAHVTAPIRRLGDRFANEIAIALCEGREPPEWVRAALPALPEILKESHRRQGELERRSLDYLEAVALAPYVGERFDAVVLEVGTRSASIQVCDPAVVARCQGECGPLGARVKVRLTHVDARRGSVRFEPATSSTRS